MTEYVRMTECVCQKCGKRNLFPDGIYPETYGWVEIMGKGWYCSRCRLEGDEK